MGALLWGQRELDFDDRRGSELRQVERLVDNISMVLLNGTELLLGRIYDSIGFSSAMNIMVVADSGLMRATTLCHCGRPTSSTS